MEKSSIPDEQHYDVNMPKFRKRPRKIRRAIIIASEFVGSVRYRVITVGSLISRTLRLDFISPKGFFRNLILFPEIRDLHGAVLV